MKDKSNVKGVNFHARIKAELYAAMRAAAKMAGLNVSAWIRKVLEESISKK